MARRDILILVNILLTLVIGIYIVSKDTSSGHRGYVVNQQLFEKFSGKEDLEIRLAELRNNHKEVLDSIAEQIAATNSDRLKLLYEETANRFSLEDSEAADRYTADIWKRINTYVADYGKEKEYEFIFGAAGDGSLMFAAEQHDITEDVIKYMNERYSKD